MGSQGDPAHLPWTIVYTSAPTSHILNSNCHRRRKHTYKDKSQTGRPPTSWPSKDSQPPWAEWVAFCLFPFLFYSQHFISQYLVKDQRCLRVLEMENITLEKSRSDFLPISALCWLYSFLSVLSSLLSIRSLQQPYIPGCVSFLREGKYL